MTPRRLGDSDSPQILDSSNCFEGWFTRARPDRCFQTDRLVNDNFLVMCDDDVGGVCCIDPVVRSGHVFIFCCCVRRIHINFVVVRVPVFVGGVVSFVLVLSVLFLPSVRPFQPCFLFFCFSSLLRLFYLFVSNCSLSPGVPVGLLGALFRFIHFWSSDSSSSVSVGSVRASFCSVLSLFLLYSSFSRVPCLLVSFRFGECFDLSRRFCVCAWGCRVRPFWVCVCECHLFAFLLFPFPSPFRWFRSVDVVSCFVCWFFVCYCLSCMFVVRFSFLRVGFPKCFCRIRPPSCVSPFVLSKCCPHTCHLFVCMFVGGRSFVGARMGCVDSRSCQASKHSFTSPSRQGIYVFESVVSADVNDDDGCKDGIGTANVFVVYNVSRGIGAEPRHDVGDVATHKGGVFNVFVALFFKVCGRRLATCKMHGLMWQMQCVVPMRLRGGAVLGVRGDNVHFVISHSPPLLYGPNDHEQQPGQPQPENSTDFLLVPGSVEPDVAHSLGPSACTPHFELDPIDFVPPDLLGGGGGQCSRQRGSQRHPRGNVTRRSCNVYWLQSH